MKHFIQKTTRIGLSLCLLAGLLAGALALSKTQNAHAWGPVIVVDDFDTGAFTLNGPAATMSVSASGAIGGVRYMLVSDSGTSSTPSVMSLTAGDGYLNIAVGDLPGNYRIGWGKGLNPAGSPLNLNASNHDRIVVTLSQAPANGNIGLTLYWGIFGDSADSPQSLMGPGDYTFLLSNFGYLDTSDIDGIKLYFDGGVPANSTIRVESVVIRSEPCPAGQYDDGNGCVPADPGYYVPVAGATEQTPCPVGTFQPASGATSCDPAEPGHFVDTTGSAAQTECALGTYQPSYGSNSCILGSPGYYVDTTGATEQIMCPTGYTSEAGASACKPESVNYNFVGFASPVDNSMMNVAKAGQTIPLKWRVTDANGVPVTGLSAADVTVSVTSLVCDLGTTDDAVEEYASGSSGLQNLGDGYYQYNWKTPKSYKNSCKTMTLDIGDGMAHTATFKFTK